MLRGRYVHLLRRGCTSTPSSVYDRTISELAPWTKKIQLLAFRSLSLQMFNNVITDMS